MYSKTSRAAPKSATTGGAEPPFHLRALNDRPIHALHAGDDAYTLVQVLTCLRSGAAVRCPA